MFVVLDSGNNTEREQYGDRCIEADVIVPDILERLDLEGCLESGDNGDYSNEDPVDR